MLWFVVNTQLSTKESRKAAAWYQGLVVVWKPCGLQHPGSLGHILLADCPASLSSLEYTIGLFRFNTLIALTVGTVNIALNTDSSTVAYLELDLHILNSYIF